MNKFIIFIAICLLSSCAKRNDLDMYGNIHGIVTDSETNLPLSGVVVSLSPTNTTKTTGSDGRYEFNNLDPALFTVQAQKHGYTSNTISVSVITGENAKGDMTLNKLIPVLWTSVTNLDFGNNLTSLPIQIKNSGSGALDWSISENATWISVNPISGTTTTLTSNVMVSVDRSLLNAGSHNQIISIISNGGNATINVTIIK
jgi:uncharacterized membrane protein